MSTYLQLVNKILQPFNEVELTSSTFASAIGFYADAKNSINSAIFDIYTYQNVEWPFAHSTTTFNTTIGVAAYNKLASYTSIDWNSFKIKRATATASSLTQSSGVATFVSSSAHNFITGDNINISGATETEYNGNFNITVVDSTTFTYSVSANTTSPATGTIVAKSNTVTEQKLVYKDLDTYKEEGYAAEDANLNSDGYGRPTLVVRNTNNNIILSTSPDRVYTIEYDGFTIPSALSVHSDTTDIPEAFEQVIIDKALHYAYMFRDNIEQAGLANSRYEDNVNKMRRILIPQWEYMRYP